MVPLTRLRAAKPTKAAVATITPAKALSPPNTKTSEVYQQRKCMLSEYRELFTALMKLPDKEMQKKIFNVINHHKTVEYRSVETQTDPVVIRDFKKEETQQEIYIIQELGPDRERVGSKACSTVNDSNKNSEEPPKGTVAGKKRKRRRKLALPHANKESRVAKQAAKISKPMPNKSKGLKNSNNLSSKSTKNTPKRLRVETFNISDVSSDIFDVIAGIDGSKKSSIQLLVREVLLSNIELESGLLPIHEAIIKNQETNLKMQIYIWKDFKKFDLNELLTNDDQDLLQLAAVTSAFPSIINLLLDAGLNPNCLDGESNTVLHLAIINDIDVLSLEYLMEKIDLKLLITLNDDGYNPLHLAVRHDRYLLAERLINILDKRLMGQSFYEREIDKYETDEKILKTQFRDFYEKICFIMEDESENVCIQNHDLKQNLLQSGDRRSGNTSLYFAIENKFDHFIYFLLAHLTDPRTENLSGIDCKTFFSEHGKSLNLTLNIDNAMEKVIKLLS